MSTLDKIKSNGEYLIIKIKGGETLTASESKELAIYNSLFSKKAINAGKRKTSVKKQRVS